jgi:hypothetical protein
VYVPAGSRRRRGLGYTGLADLVVRWNRGRGLGAISSQYSTVADAVVRQEGYNSTLAPLNNPGNLIYAGQTGATPVTVGGTTWASFPTYDAGYQALLNQIALDASRGLTISQFTAKYAPAASGNDPVTYAANIAAATGLSPNSLLSAAAGGSGGPYNFDTGALDNVAIGDQTGGTFSSVSLLDNPWALAVGGLAAAVLVLAVLE